MADATEIRTLVAKAVKKRGESTPAPAPADALSLLERTIGPLPSPLRDWLSLHNGAAGLLGVATKQELRNNPYAGILGATTRNPDWTARGWIPVAGDDCGNFYVLERASGRVLFVDRQVDPGAAAFVAASSPWSFLKFFLLAEIKGKWPTRNEVLSEDPALDRFTDLPRIWD
jgi:hypothetical protein